MMLFTFLVFYDIFYLRLGILSGPALDDLFRTRFGLPVRSRFPNDRRILRTECIPTPNRFISWHPSRLPVLAERLTAATRSTVSELVVHPGYFDPDCSYPYNRERADELAFLKSPRFQRLVSGFQLMRYTDLANPRQHVRKSTSAKPNKRIRRSAGRT